MKLIVASLVKDEMGRFFERALAAWTTFADEIVVLDDGSSDGSAEAAFEAGACVYTRKETKSAWGAEVHARKRLFEIAWSHARVGDWILWLDADMTPARSPRPLLTPLADALAFKLYDLWTPTEFRSDSFWRGHEHFRTWGVQRTAARVEDFSWNERGVHCGHLPLEFNGLRPIFAPDDFSLLHYAYVAQELREEKYIAYASVASELTPHERAHAASILDPDPALVRLPFYPELSLV